MVRKAVERLYNDTATIITYDNTDIDEYGKVRQCENIHKSIPCRLSYKGSPATSGDVMPVFVQSITLFIAPDIEVPEGAAIDVIRNGTLLHFKSAGVAQRYQSHQEISLERREERG